MNQIIEPEMIEDFEETLEVYENNRVLLTGICLDGENYDEALASLDELERLVDTAGLVCVGKMLQRRKKPDQFTYVGKGYAAMLQEAMQDKQASMLVFDNELAPKQSQNLGKILAVPVIDRTEIILQIFHQHARTAEAKYQVKLAELKYQLPRLKQLWGHFDREAGSARASGGGSATRGMGEKQLEIDKRRIRSDIAKIERLLNRIMSQNETQRKLRQDMKKICIVGYTNAGKSTLFNYLTQAGVLVEDKLFATLDSTTRSLKIEKGEEVALSDTVGFISHLPHHLVASFRATLKEVVDADLLLHLVDISDERSRIHIQEVEKVLDQLKADSIPRILVANKTDKLSLEQLKFLKHGLKEAYFISSVTGEGIPELLKYIDDQMHTTITKVLLIPYTEQRLVPILHQKAKILTTEFEETGTKFTVEMHTEDEVFFEKYFIN
jgi:GTPase